ncbi:hypothetical protein MKJ04_02460 [Pontibacter sp. E15-1]|uniref:hypothetical protein n=1 Tax=Pontibacter sp. E15-1 TaxID=2919918 RepID=UPI001F4F8C3F|nr:hypothetical protein [Pontibacter sp. E15-1]MCJ8163687.1 hypothetical protein [Pontibacter sp. E15-1]
MRKALLLVLALTGFFAGCEEKYKESDPEAMGYGYYPLAVGDTRVYQVTDIQFKNDEGDTLRFQMQERVDTTFLDQTNTLNYKIIRSVRPDAESPWKEDSVLVVSRSVSSLLLTQDNTRYVKLVFPVRTGKTWQGDAYNNHTVNIDQKETYTYAAAGEPYTVSDQTYGNTVTVIQGTPTKNLVQLDERREVYAEGVGRIYRIFNRVVYCNETTGSNTCPFGEDYKLDGHERHEELISYSSK